MSPILPDILLLLLAALIMILDLYRAKLQPKTPFHMSWIGLLIIFGLLTIMNFDRETIILASYKVSGTGLLFKQIFVLSALFTVLLSGSYFTPGGNIRGMLKYRSEFYFIILLCTFGMFTVVSATGLLTLFIGMELATIPLYILSGYQKDDTLAVEASTKYIIMAPCPPACCCSAILFFTAAPVL